MELISVDIVNYKSIKEETITFSDNCRALVGMNESGKTNIIDALSHLDKTRDSERSDKRQPSFEEGPIKESYIRFNFKFDQHDYKKITAIYPDRLISVKDEWVLELDGKKYKFKDLMEFYQKSFFKVDLLNQKRRARCWKVSKEFRVNKNWKKFNPDLGDEVIQIEDKSINSNNIAFIQEGICDDNLLVEIELEDVLMFVRSSVNKYVSNNLPRTMYWHYTPECLLPGQIDLESFKQNPDICLPLKNMFELDNNNPDFDIKTFIDSEHQDDPQNGVRNLLNRVAEKTTKHIHKVWKEHKRITVELSQDGPFIKASVKDAAKNHYEFSKRSDGFKRFVSFLLFVSIKNETKDLSNALILVDEPEYGLHPSGIKFLRDELIKISKKNKVVYSTHSTFMIDRNRIERHLIVKKNKEITSWEQAEDDNIPNEEVIYNALGASAFEVLEEKNIIFEGWRDKRLFSVGLEGIRKKKSIIYEHLSSMGTCHSHGARSIKDITPVIEMANRKCWIVSDSDTAAEDARKEYKRRKGHGKWWTYKDINKAYSGYTGEDFLIADVFKKPMDSIAERYSLGKFKYDSIKEPGKRIQKIRGLLYQKKLEQEEVDNEIREIKSVVFDNLKEKDIHPRYYTFLEALSKKIK